MTMRALILVHRWLGVAFCLLFAMWFGSGIVMHFVTFPALTEAQRFAGMAPIDTAALEHGPAEAVSASGIEKVTRVRLLQRSDGAVYLVSGSGRVAALRAADLSDAAVHSEPLALSIAVDDARRRNLETAEAGPAGVTSYDQWTVSNAFDPDRPLYRIDLHDGAGTELHVSSATGEVVLETTRRQRMWNYFGSVAHWIYATPLRRHQAAWQLAVWWLSLAAMIGAGAGAVIGTMRIGAAGSRLLSPYRGWQAWHHRFGLLGMLFVLSWIFSGWLSMDDGRLFSSGKPSGPEIATVAGTPVWTALPPDELRRIRPHSREVEWFAFDGQIYRRERIETGIQSLVIAGSVGGQRAVLESSEVDAAMRRLSPACKPARAVTGDDAYAPASLPRAALFRAICGDDWFYVDGSSGAVVEKLDSSGRAYRWLFTGLHTLDFPVLTARPALRTSLIVALCGFGLILSLTAIVIACRRLQSCFRAPERR